MVRFFERVLVHTKGEWAGVPFRLTPWQRDEIIAPLFGRVEPSAEWGRWVRQYRIGWIELGRKNGKSELLAGVALALLCIDGEDGAEIWGCARDRDQARVVFDVAERMVELSPVLSRQLRIYRMSKRLVDFRTASFYGIIAADAAGNLGLNPHGVIFDEVLTQPSDDLWNVMRTAMGARSQPLMLAATTAGDNPHAFVAQEHAYCAQIARQPRLDRRRFVYMRNTPERADPFDEAQWPAANPALGDFLSWAALRDEAREAQLSPVKLNAFRQFRLNQWVQALTRWLDIRRWDRSAGAVSGFDEGQLHGRRCFGGLDLASTQDLTALAWVFPPADLEAGEFEIIWRLWLPAARRADLELRTSGASAVWERDGWLTMTEGDVLDHRAVFAQIDEDARKFDVAELAFDRWGMTQMMTDLAEGGLVVVPFGQGFASMSAPTKEFERLVLQRRLFHHGNPVARWMAGNVVVRRDPADNLKPDKAKSTEKIDGIVAAIMALDRALRQPEARRSAYEEAGLLTV